MKQLKIFFLVFLAWILVGVLGKIAFIAVYGSILGFSSASEFFQIISHGLILDSAIAGYLTIIPALLLIVSYWYRGRVVRYVWSGYFALVSFLTALALVANTVLYGYWGYPLNSSPLLYLRTSPADAMASTSVFTTLLLICLILVITALLTRLFSRMYPQVSGNPHRITCSVLLLLLTISLILPIRGGLGTGTNHTGSVYFSSNIRLNHAAVNPVFSFIESVSHQQDIGSMYRFMDDHVATALTDSLLYTSMRTDNVEYLSTHRPDIVLIMLEGFSTKVMETGATPNLQRLCREGLYFSNFYANSVRTDRAMVSILSGLPAQPTMSIMDVPEKSTSLPSLARSLGREGYSSCFYYGGDTNYSNMRSYYMGTGYERIVEESDFPVNQRTMKWGVPDGIVYDRMLEDINHNSLPLRKGQGGSFLTLMTESSHEPFDVPYKSSFSDPAINAFAYADHCLGEFIKGLKALPCWQNLLVVIVPDHLGAYPDVIDNYALWRYQIPLLMTGGAVSKKMNIPTLGCQTDIAATLLGMIGLPHDDFPWSHDILDPQAPHYAFFSFDDAMGMVTDSGYVIYDNISDKVINHSGDHSAQTNRSKACLQKLFDYINQL